MTETTGPVVPTDSEPPLPAGCTTRPLTAGDARAVYDLVVASELHDVGERVVDLEDIVSDWQRPSFDLEEQAVGVELEGELVAYAEVYAGWRADAHVPPAHRGRGIGTWLAWWVRQEARREGGTVVGMPVPEGSDGDRLLTGLGYHVRWTSWVLELPPGAVIASQPLPDGYEIRDLAPGGEQAAYRVVEDAFGEWPDRVPTAYADWAASTLLRPGFEPGLLRVVHDATGEAVGVCLLVLSGDCAYVQELAVRADRRGLGLARALLVDGFARGRARGATRSELSTDSRTGALGLYERVGMVVTSTWVHRGIAL